MIMPLLEVSELSVDFGTGGGAFRAVDGVSLAVDAGEILAIVGEIRLGQVGRHAGGDGPAALDGDGHRRSGSLSTATTCWRSRRASGAGWSARTSP